MFTEPVTTIDETISHLRGCADLLKGEFDQTLHKELTKDGRICREAHLAIQSLLPLLREARATQVSPSREPRPPMCVDRD